jgi:hypothetical protein
MERSRHVCNINHLTDKNYSKFEQESVRQPLSDHLKNVMKKKSSVTYPEFCR